MTRSWFSLPAEVWLNAFNQVESVKQLVECRLVCKAWDPLAEQAMFGQKLGEIYDSSFPILYKHLAKKPVLARYIKYMKISVLIMTRSSSLKEFFELAITPNFKVLGGSYVDGVILDVLLQVYENSPFKFKNIQQIPTPMRLNETYTKLIYAFKDTLRHVDISLREEDFSVMKSTFDHINEFKNLTSLDFAKMDYRDVMEIETFLNGLQNLQRLKLIYGFITVNRYPKSRNEMIKWLQEHIQKNENLMELTLSSEFRLEFYQFMLEYVMLKYPNIKTLILNDLLIRDQFHRVHAAIMHIPTIRFENCSGKSPKYLRMLTKLMKSANNSIHIRFRDGYLLSDLCYLTVLKTMKTDTTSFEAIIPGDESHYDIMRAFINIDPSTITDLNINLMHDMDWGFVEQRNYVTFYHMFRIFPQTQKLRFTDAFISYKNIERENLAMKDLKWLEICGAGINHLMFTQLSGMAPQLDTLTLSSCFVFEDENADENADETENETEGEEERKEKEEDGEDEDEDEEEDRRFRKHKKITLLNMPQSSLSNLSILIKDFGWSECMQNKPDVLHIKKIQRVIDISEVAYLRLITLKFNQEEHLKLTSSGQALKISKEEFMLNYKRFPLIDICCKSLLSFNINVGDICIKMDFEAGKLKN